MAAGLDSRAQDLMLLFSACGFIELACEDYHLEDYRCIKKSDLLAGVDVQEMSPDNVDGVLFLIG